MAASFAVGIATGLKLWIDLVLLSGLAAVAVTAQELAVFDDGVAAFRPGRYVVGFHFVQFPDLVFAVGTVGISTVVFLTLVDSDLCVLVEGTDGQILFVLG